MPKAFYFDKNQNIGFRGRSLKSFNLKFANINFVHVRKQSFWEKFGHFPSTEQLFFFH